MTRLPQTTMVSPIDAAWNVAKGEPFHPSVAGYMGRSKPSNLFPFMANRRIQRPTADFENRISGKDDGFEGEEERALASRVDDTQDVQRLAQGGYLGRRPASHVLRRSSDSPIDTAWSILKELSREDLQHAARTGGIPMTEARRQAYEDEGLPLSTGGGFRTMPDTEAQLMMETQRRFRQGGGNLPPGMTDERFERMGMEDVRSNQVHDADEFGDPNFEPESDSLEPEGRMGFNLAHASLEDPSFAERYDPEPEIDPELSQFQTGTTPSNPFELAIHSIEQKRRQKAYEQHLLQQQRQRMAQAQRPQMSQSSRARRPGESKNAYRKRMSRGR